MTVTSRLHRQKDKARQRKTEEKVERRPVVTPRYESGGEAQALVRPPTVGFRVIIDGLVPIPEVTLSFVFGKEIQQAKKIPMNAPGRGDYRREESLTHTLPGFVNLLLCPLREHMIDVRMTQGSILRRVSSVAMKLS